MSTDNTEFSDAPEPENQPSDLVTDARASWQSFSVDKIVAAGVNYPTDAREALVGLYRWCTDARHPVAKADAARALGISDNMLYKLLTGKYRHAEFTIERNSKGEETGRKPHPRAGEQLAPSPALVKAMRNFVELQRERQQGGDMGFCPTPTSRKITTACDLARESQSIVFMWGPSHIGKTMALENYTDENNHGRTIYSRMEAASGLYGMVKRITEDYGISDSSSNTRKLVGRLMRTHTPDSLLILDEMHLLAHTYRKSSFHNCMEVVREIHDRTRGGIVLCFTILDDVRAASQKELQQLWRRGVHKVPLPLMPTKGDIGAILAANALPFPGARDQITVNGQTESPYEMLRQTAKTDGLKAITERIRYGRKLAAKADSKLKWEHVVDAHLRIAKQAEQEGEWK